MAVVERALAAARLVAEDVGQLLDDAADSSGLAALTRECLSTFVEAVLAAALTEVGDGPPVVAARLEEHAVRWAAEGYSLPALVRLYGIAHRLAMHSAFVGIESDPRVAAAGPGLLARAAELGTQMHVAAIERLMAGFARVQARDRRAAGDWKLRLVRRILTGEPVDEAPLGYRLRGSHIAIVLHGPDAESSATAVQEAWPGRTLRICESRQTLWLWLAGPSSDRPIPLPRRLVLPVGTAMAIGDPGEGSEGFRESHRQALVAMQLGSHAGRAVAYEEVALVALLMHDRSRARRFVAAELRELDADSEARQRDRETVRAYLDCRYNLASAAARLGLHKNTLLKRLRGIEARLGRTLQSRSTELDVALRLPELGLDPTEPPR